MFECKIRVRVVLLCLVTLQGVISWLTIHADEKTQSDNQLLEQVCACLLDLEKSYHRIKITGVERYEAGPVGEYVESLVTFWNRDAMRRLDREIIGPVNDRRIGTVQAAVIKPRLAFEVQKAPKAENYVVTAMGPTPIPFELEADFRWYGKFILAPVSVGEFALSKLLHSPDVLLADVSWREFDNSKCLVLDLRRDAPQGFVKGEVIVDPKLSFAVRRWELEMRGGYRGVCELEYTTRFGQIPIVEWRIIEWKKASDGSVVERYEWAPKDVAFDELSDEVFSMHAFGLPESRPIYRLPWLWAVHVILFAALVSALILVRYFRRRQWVRDEADEGPASSI